MNTKVAIHLSLAALFLLAAYANAAEKVVGTCTVKIDGPNAVSITGKLYEGKAPAGAVESSASTRAWALKNAEEYRPHSSVLADQTAKMADTLAYAFMISCASDKGRVGLQPYDGRAKPEDYPGGPKTFRLVGNNTRDKKSGDLMAIAMLTGSGFVVLDPTQPGELKVTQSDGDRLVATFSYKSGQSTVTGSVDFTRPKALAK
ncbi:MAG TPA: hypothetical protein VET48_05955 [Steroidobacteraceae bacterium]|nr:hypothetical protein [Steroidobacteraceae bacterium]